MSNIIEFEEVDNEQNILRVGGMSLLPADMEWPVNPNDKIISVFTTYNLDDYFLDSIVYHGNGEELERIKNGFTR